MNKLIEVFASLIKSFYVKILTSIFPSQTVSTFFGLGYLPEWQAHWSSLLTIPIIVLIVYIFTGFEGSIGILSFPALVGAIVVFFVGMLAIYIFQLKDSSEGDEIMIHTVCGQIFVLALSGPPVISISNNIIGFNDFLCEKFLYCAPWFYWTITFVPIFLVPYFSYRFVDTFKPWPSSVIDRDYNNPFSKMAEGTINGVYTLLFLYLLGFILFDLTMDEALAFFNETLYLLLIKSLPFLERFIQNV